jgi:hypothetical protein
MFNSTKELAEWMKQTSLQVIETFSDLGIHGIEVGRWGLDGFVYWGDRNDEWQGHPELLEADAGYLCPDHYFPAESMPEDEFKKMRDYYPKARIWICEWGATYGQSPEYVEAFMRAARNAGVTGFNYWQAGPAGPESLFRFNDAGELEVTDYYEVVKKYYKRTLVW